MDRTKRIIIFAWKTNNYKMTQEEDIKNAVEVLRRGGVILYPTDTVWGIGCDATNAEAVARVYQIKHRDDSKALICLVDSDARLQRYVRNVPAVAWDLLDAVVKPTTVILDGAVNLAPNLIAEDGKDRTAHHQRAFLTRTVLPVPESTRQHQRQHQWAARGTKLR